MPGCLELTAFANVSSCSSVTALHRFAETDALSGTTEKKEL